MFLSYSKVCTTITITDERDFTTGTLKAKVACAVGDMAVHLGLTTAEFHDQYNVTVAGTSTLSSAARLKSHVKFTSHEGDAPSLSKMTDMYNPQFDEARVNGDTDLSQLAQETHVHEITVEVAVSSPTLTLRDGERIIKETSDIVFGKTKNNNANSTGGGIKGQHAPEGSRTKLSSKNAHFYIQGTNLGVYKEKGRAKSKLDVKDEGIPVKRKVRSDKGTTGKRKERNDKGKRKKRK